MQKALSCTQPDPKYFSLLHKKHPNRNQVLKNEKAKQGIKFRTVHTHRVKRRKNLRAAKSRWGCEHVCACAYIYRFSWLCVFLACCTPSNHPIMVNVQQEISKCSKLSQIWLNIQKHFSVADVFTVLSIPLHTKPLSPIFFIKLNVLLKLCSIITRNCLIEISAFSPILLLSTLPQACQQRKFNCRYK